MNEKENMFCVVHTIATVWALAKKKRDWVLLKMLLLSKKIFVVTPFILSNGWRIHQKFEEMKNGSF